MIVREIVEAHGGEVGAEPADAEGSIFWIRLPPTRLAGRDAALVGPPEQHEQHPEP